MAGQSENHLYVTGAAADQAFETVLHLGCEGANGLNPDTQKAQIVDGIWGEFSGNNTRRVDGVQMEYSHAVTGFGYNAAQMLSRADGFGQCTAWSDLLALTLRAQGVSGASEQNITTGTGYRRFRVNLTTGQGGGLPATEFGFHRVVRIACYPDMIFDPSYGTMVIKDDWRSVEVKYEDLYVTHMQLQAFPSNWVINSPSNYSHLTDPNQQQLLWSPLF